MSSFEDLDVAFNVKLYKMLRIYDIFDPKSTKIFGYNYYRCTGIIITVLTQLYVLFGLTGYLIPMEDTINYIEQSMLIFVGSVNFLAAIKTCVIIYKANNTWDLFDVTRINFLKSKQCCKYRNKILEKVRNKSIRLTNFIFVFAIISWTIWMIYPLVMNFYLMTTDQNNHQYYQSILYLRYPVTTNNYNQYYFVFYTTEGILAFGIIYYSILIDTVLVSFCWVFIAQYEILSEAFGNIKYDDKEKDGSIKAYNDFLSVLNDQRRLNSKLKLYYSIVLHMVLTYVVFCSCSIIALTYSFIMTCISTNESSPLFFKIKIITPIILLLFQLFLYCYFFGLINLKKESVIYGMFSCDWTSMDLKFKKLLLLSMRMNGADKLMLKATPTKIINLEFFVKVMITTYNIVSVMLNSLNSKT
ncbi:uncharacterized protein LOC112592593 [Melanaphis sacchari]|uniref:uncharacterized protein LOC112592593 n=1 Tax=Melanaphis sacchari TaxID=742174 RepID=UPI000DC139BD|nr:uncharacterized protein LOC112592593 [Melanaphis sacchari]